LYHPAACCGSWPQPVTIPHVLRLRGHERGRYAVSANDMTLYQDQVHGINRASLLASFRRRVWPQSTPPPPPQTPPHLQKNPSTHPPPPRSPIYPTTTRSSRPLSPTALHPMAPSPSHYRPSAKNSFKSNLSITPTNTPTNPRTQKPSPSPPLSTTRIKRLQTPFSALNTSSYRTMTLTSCRKTIRHTRRTLRR
jgi:hypothetical protein